MVQNTAYPVYVGGYGYYAGYEEAGYYSGYDYGSYGYNGSYQQGFYNSYGVYISYAEYVSDSKYEFHGNLYFYEYSYSGYPFFVDEYGKIGHIGCDGTYLPGYAYHAPC